MSFLFLGHSHEVKHKQPHPGFELGSPNLFSMMITILQTVSLK